MKVVRLYEKDTEPTGVYFIEKGRVLHYISSQDRYALTGQNIISGATELIMSELLNEEGTLRIETAVVPADTKVKKISKETFISGINNPGFSVGVAITLARQVKSTNEILDRNMTDLEGDEMAIKDITSSVYRAIKTIRDEFEKRRTPWLKELSVKYGSSLTCARGEAYVKSSEPVVMADVADDEETVEYPRSSIICEEGEKGDEMYILQSGAVDVYVGTNRVATIEEHGVVIGEMALLLGETRTATLKARNTVYMNRIARSELKSRAQQNPKIIETLAVSLAKRHYYNTKRIQEVNSMLIDQNLKAEESQEERNRQKQILHKAEHDRRELRDAIDDVMRKHEAPFLKGLLD